MVELSLHVLLNGTPEYLLCIADSDVEYMRVSTVQGARPKGDHQVRFNPDLFVVRELRHLLRETLILTPETDAWYTTQEAERMRLVRLTQSRQLAGEIGVALPQPLRDYQCIGAKWLAERKRGLLGDEMGLGKTIEALVATKLVQARRVLIVTMAISKWQWQEEIKEWLGEDATVADGSEKERKEHIASFDTYLIIHYDMLRGAITKPATKNAPSVPPVYPELALTRWDVVIFDEAHKLQSPKSQQSKAALAVARKASHIFELTGTPIWDMPDSLWHLLHILDPTVLSSYWTFVNQYCVTKETPYGTKVVGIRQQTKAELKERLVGYILQRYKQDVAPELPAKIYTTLHYDLSAKQRREYTRLTEELRIDYATGARHFSGTASTLPAMRKLCNNPHSLGLNHDSPKDKLLLDLVKTMVEQTPKVVILCWHKDYIDHIKELLTAHAIPCALATGDTPAAERIQAVNAFRDSDTPVLLGTIAAIGTALNIGYVTNVIFAELDWTPPMNKQAEDRFHRLTSTKTVNMYYLIGRDTIEQHILEVTQRKTFLTTEMLSVQSVVESILATA